MTMLILIPAAMLAIMWFVADRRPRRQVLFPSFTGPGMSGGKPNEYLPHMCKIGAIMGVVLGLVGGGIFWLVSVLP